MAEEVIQTPEERLKQLSDVLVGNIVESDDMSMKLRRMIFGQVSPKVFRDENYIIVSVLYNFKDRLITPDTDFLKLYLMRNQKLIKDSSDYIDINAYKDLDENPVIGYISAVIKQFERLKSVIQPISEEEFELELEKYKTEWSSFEINKAYSQAKMILYDGLQYGRRFYQGYDDSVAYVKKRISEVEAVLDHTTGDGFIDGKQIAESTDEEVKPVKIGDFGLVRELNDHFGGYYTSNFYNVMAPTKGGKSKWTARAIHNIVVENGNNASVWAHEGGYKAWWAQLRAIHFEYMFIRNAEPDKRVAPLSQQDILYGTYPSDAIRELEAISHLDLVDNANYGKINMIDRPFKVETFIDEIETSVQLNDSKAVLIDYLQLIGWDSKNLSKPQAIGRAYQDLLAYAKKRNVLVMSPSQFTQEFMNEMAKSKDGASHELRTAGGESSEIIRTPDINIALYSNTDDLMRKEMTIMSVPSRLASPFPSFKIYCDLCSCVFSSLEGE